MGLPTTRQGWGLDFCELVHEKLRIGGGRLCVAGGNGERKEGKARVRRGQGSDEYSGTREEGRAVAVEGTNCSFLYRKTKHP